MRIAYFTDSTDFTAIDHYRIIGPAKYAGAVVTKILPHDMQTLSVNPGYHDLFYIGRGALKYARECERFLSIAKEQYRPSVLDLDDDLLNLPENHPDFITGAYAPALFSLSDTIQRVDAVTVSTEFLAHTLEAVTQAPIYIVPNSLDEKLWGIKPAQAVQHGGPVTILFFGSPSHVIDLPVIADALEAIHSKYSHAVRVILYGIPEPNPPFRFPYSHMVSETYVYQKFPEKIKKVEAKIGLAPLSSSLFNHSKSPIKFYEYTAMGLVTIASKIGPYQQAVNHGVNGLLASTAEEWFEGLSSLIESEKLREELVINAQSDLQQNWTMERNSVKWLDTLSRVQLRAVGSEPILSFSDTFLQRLKNQIQNYMIAQTTKLEKLEAAYSEVKRQREN